MNYFTPVLTQVLGLITAIAAGYIIYKLKVVPENSDRVLSNVLALIVSPAFSFNAFSNNINVSVLASKLQYLVFGIITFALSIIIGFALSFAFSKEPYTRFIYAYSLSMSNYGYMGYPLIKSVFGETVLTNMMIFAIPFYIFIFGLAYPILTGHNKISIKYLINPVFIGMLLGAVVGLSGIKLPEFFTNIAGSFGDCMGPIAMLVTGIVVAKYDLLKLISKKSSYVVSVLRMTVIPAVTILLLKFIGAPKDIIIISLGMTAMSLGLNTVVYPAACGRDTTIGASLALISNVFSIITVPLMFFIFA